MAITKTILDQFIAYGDAVFAALNGYDVHEDKMGRACARGTLTARLNTLRVIAAALELREASGKDAAELKGMVSALRWLTSDTYVTKDFAGIELTVVDTGFAAAYPTVGATGETDFVSLIISLVRGLEDLLLIDA